jgi:hypothetical protein
VKPPDSAASSAVVGMADRLPGASEVGTVGGLAVAFAIAFSKLAPRLGLFRRETESSELLLKNLTSRIAAQSAEMDALRVRYDTVLAENAVLSVRVARLETELQFMKTGDFGATR